MHLGILGERRMELLPEGLDRRPAPRLAGRRAHSGKEPRLEGGAETRGVGRGAYRLS